jgi:hypothetical protein
LARNDFVTKHLEPLVGEQQKTTAEIVALYSYLDF